MKKIKPSELLEQIKSEVEKQFCKGDFGCPRCEMIGICGIIVNKLAFIKRLGEKNL
jgi:hypothetical protein